MRNAMQNNDDGWGFVARLRSGEMVVRRGIGGYDSFANAIEPYAEAQMAIHFRMATHGSVRKGNCHPFMISPTLAVVHNGVIPIEQNVDKDRSDTWHFVELILKKFHAIRKDFWMRQEFKFTIEAATSGSKLVFLRSDGTWGIYNEGYGHWIDKIWYSNKSHQWKQYAYKQTGLSIPDSWSGRYDFKAGSAAAEDRKETEDYYQRLWSQQLEEDSNLSAIGDDMELIVAKETEADDSFNALATAEYRRRIVEWGMTEDAVKDVEDNFGFLGLEALADLT